MSLRRTLAITVRLLEQFRHDRRTLAILFVTPIVVLGLFYLLLRNDDAPSPSVGVVVEDEGDLIASISDELLASDELDVTEVDSASDAEAMVRDGELDAYAVLPAPDEAGVIRPLIVLEGTDPNVAGVLSSEMQTAVLAGIAAFVPPLPPGAPALELPEVEVEVDTVYGEDLDQLDLFGGPFIGLLVFFIVYIVTSVSFLRERSLGTLERLMASPLRRAEIVIGYMLGFTLIALVQAALVLAFSLWVIDIYNAGSVLLIFGIEVLLALVAVNLGIFLSTFARNEFQAVQFIPLVILPQVLLSGLLVPVESEPQWLQVISNLLPLTYAVDALRDVMLRGAGLSSSSIQLDLAVLIGFGALVVMAAALTLRREVA